MTRHSPYVTGCVASCVAGGAAGFAWLALPGLMLLAGTTLPAVADVLVLESNVAAYARGTTLGDDTVIVAPAGRRLTVLRPAGETLDIVGPRTLKVGDLTRGERLDEGVWQRTKELLAKQSGDKSGYGAGATRGATR